MLCLMVMALPTANCSNVSSLPHPESITSDDPNPLSVSNGGLAERPFEGQVREPSFLKIVGKLQSLSSVMQKFHCRWDELQKLIDFIENAIENREKQLLTLHQSIEPKDFETNVGVNKSESSSFIVNEKTEGDKSGIQKQETEQMDPISSSTGKTTVCELPGLQNQELEHIAPTSFSTGKTTGCDMPGFQNQESEQTSNSSFKTKNPPESDLDLLCKNMSFRELRKYTVTHLKQSSKLCKEVPSALRHAPNPAELVLKCVGRFFLQARKGFAKNPAMIQSRQAAILILQCFLLMGCDNAIDEAVKQEAEQAALAWRKRLISEGGVSNSLVEDARGLLLLVACFGIPSVISVEDLIHLLRLSNPQEISQALRKSSFLVVRLPGIIEFMGNKGMNIEALDIIYTFGIEDKCLQRILAPFLKSLKEASKKARNDANDSPFMLKEANQKQLNALKALMNCLEVHQIDPAKVIPGWKLKEKMTNLEKDIAELDRKIVSKRRAEQHSYRVSTIEDAKRPKTVGESSLPMPSPFSSLQEPRGLTSQVYQLGSRYSDPINNYPASSSCLHDYGTLGICSWPSLSGGSFGASVPSRSSLHLSSGDRIVEHNSVRSSELGSHAYMGSLSSAERFQVATTFGDASRTMSSDLYRFADVLERDMTHTYKSGDMPVGTSYRSPFLR